MKKKLYFILFFWLSIVISQVVFIYVKYVNSSKEEDTSNQRIEVVSLIPFIESKFFIRQDSIRNEVTLLTKSGKEVKYSLENTCIFRILPGESDTIPRVEIKPHSEECTKIYVPESTVILWK